MTSTSPAPPTGRLNAVDIKVAWPGDASDFTPWLANDEPLALLGETLGMELEFVEAEKGVSPFRADIVERENLKPFLSPLEEINAELSFPLIWHYPENKKPARAWIAQPTDISNRESWPNACQWLIDHLEKMHNTFSRRLRGTPRSY